MIHRTRWSRYTLSKEYLDCLSSSEMCYLFFVFVIEHENDWSNDWSKRQQWPCNASSKFSSWKAVNTTKAARDFSIWSLVTSPVITKWNHSLCLSFLWVRKILHYCQAPAAFYCHFWILHETVNKYIEVWELWPRISVNLTISCKQHPWRQSAL